MTLLLGGFYSIYHRINYIASMHFSSNVKEKLYRRNTIYCVY